MKNVFKFLIIAAFLVTLNDGTQEKVDREIWSINGNLVSFFNKGIKNIVCYSPYSIRKFEEI